MNALKNYKWFKYTGKKTVVETKDPEYDINLKVGDRYAYRKFRNKHYIVPRTDLDYKFEVTVKEAKRIILSSEGWSGKIKGVVVEAGVGGKDKATKKPKDNAKKRDNDEVYDLTIDSSNLKKAWYDKKEKELHVIFHNDAHWAYEEVSLKLAQAMERADSQGSFFHYKIKQVKPQYRVSK